MLFFVGSEVMGQGVSQPLTIQGINQEYLVGARGRAMGGAFTAIADDATAMFWNPAGMVDLSSLNVSVGFVQNNKEWAESQRWSPNRYYGGSSLFFQNESAYGLDPFDDPDWTYDINSTSLGHVAVVLPLNRIAVGLAYHHAVDLDDYDRNDNVLSPNIGTLRPEPLARPVNPEDTVRTTWSSYSRGREGTIHAFTPAVSIRLLQNISLGVSASYWTGSSDDREAHTTLGGFEFRSSAHDYNFVEQSGSSSWVGSSDYEALSAQIGVKIAQPFFTIGAVVNLPTKLTRTWSRSLSTVDGTGQTSNAALEGEDEITLPAAITMGVTLRPSDRMNLAVAYKLQDYDQMEVTSASADLMPAWKATNGLRLGLEWNPKDWLALRAGFREDPRPFEVEGSGLIGETAKGNIFSGGFGVSWNSLSVDAVYEFHQLVYFDRWESNVNQARERSNTFMLTTSWSF